MYQGSVAHDKENNGVAEGVFLVLKEKTEIILHRREKQVISTSMGFEPMTSANTSAMLYQLSYEATHREPSHFCGFYLSHERNR